MVQEHTTAIRGCNHHELHTFKRSVGRFRNDVLVRSYEQLSEPYSSIGTLTVIAPPTQPYPAVSRQRRKDLLALESA